MWIQTPTQNWRRIGIGVLNPLLLITHFNNRYQVIQILAEGGFGQTFFAEG
jgi:hypothetical protein